MTLNHPTGNSAAEDFEKTLEHQLAKEQAQETSWKARLRRFGARLLQISSFITASTLFFTFFGFLFQKYFWPLELEIRPPDVVEFRCSNVSFDPARCFDRQRLGDSHLSVSAAFTIIVRGFDLREAAIDRAVVTVRIGQKPKAVSLIAFWQADLVPGQSFRRQQVVPTILSGGKTLSQELWFFPIPRICNGEPPQNCDERANFLPWHRFVVGDIQNRVRNIPTLTTPGDKLIYLDFQFNWRQDGEERKSVTVACTVEIGATMDNMTRHENETLYIIAPCREAFVAPVP